VGYNRDRDSADQFVADMLTKTRHHGASASHTGATSARREIAAARSQEVIDEHGRLVDVLSVVAETGNIGQATYAASKSGLFGLTKTLAKEAAYQLAKSGKSTDDGIGITVNTVTPA